MGGGGEWGVEGGIGRTWQNIPFPTDKKVKFGSLACDKCIWWETALSCFCRVPILSTSYPLKQYFFKMWSENISRRATNSYKELSWAPTTALPNQSFQGEPGKHPSEIARLGYSLNRLKFGSHHPKTFPGGSDGKESVCNTGDPGLIPGSRRTLGEGNSNPLQYSCLETPMDRGAWQATIRGVIKSRAWLEWLTLHISP